LSGFYPALSYISSITNAQNAVIGFPFDHDFTVGEIVSFRVSPPYGMFEINNQQSVVIDKTLTTITTRINSTDYTPFRLLPYQIPIVNILVDTPSTGFAQIVFTANPFLNGEKVYLQNVQGSIAPVINNKVFLAMSVTSTTINIAVTSTGLAYTSGGNATIYPPSLFVVPPVCVPSSSGIIPDSIPRQTNLLDAFDNIPPP